MTRSFDPDTLSLGLYRRPGSPRPRAQRQTEPFLKGPVPLAWLGNAARLPGKALHAGIALWYRAGIEGALTVKLTGPTAAKLGMNRNAKGRALDALERAGLVAVVRQSGKNPVVTILVTKAK